MVKGHLYYKNEDGEPEEDLEELEDDPEFKELGDEDSEGTENPDGAYEDGILGGENEMPETE